MSSQNAIKGPGIVGKAVDALTNQLKRPGYDSQDESNQVDFQSILGRDVSLVQGPHRQTLITSACSPGDTERAAGASARALGNIHIAPVGKKDCSGVFFAC